jgi:hypothetical protein
VDGGFFVVDVGFFTTDGFFAVAFVTGFRLAVVFFAVVFDGLTAGFAAGFFVVSGMGIVCPWCCAKTGVLAPAKTARTAERAATIRSDIV